MEQKKTLWIIAATGLFLLVVFLGAMIIYKPSNSTTPTVVNYPVEKVQDTTGWTPKEEEPVVVTPEDDGVPIEEEGSLNVSDLFVVSENTTIYDLNGNPASTTDSQGVTTIDLNALKNQLIGEEKAPQSQNINITVNIPEAEVVTKTENVPATTTVKTETKTAAQAEKEEKAASVVKQTATPSSSTTTTKAPASTGTKTTTKPASTSTSTTTAKTTTTATKPAATATTNTTVTRYWVQVASYSTKKAAEAARKTLVENKILADIFTFQDSTGKLYYRVRVGPYTTKSEAEYWMNKVTQIKLFEKSGAYVTKTVN